MNALILAAAGSGSRFGSETPKQFLPLDGIPVFVRALLPFLPYCAEIVVVVPPGWEKFAETALSHKTPTPARIQAGGAQRQDSVHHGLLALGSDCDIVLVHDAARPFVCSRLIESVIAAAERHSACIPGLPITDTVKEVENGWAVRTLDRNRLISVQTPQGFRRETLARALVRAAEDKFYGTDEASLVERLGIPVHIVPGSPENRKITWKSDLFPGQGADRHEP